MNSTTFRASRRQLVFHRGSAADLVAFTGRVLLRAAVIIVPFLVSVAAFNAADTHFQEVVIALLILIYCGIRAVGLTLVERGQLALITAQEMTTALARRSSHFDLEPFVAALKSMRAERERSRLQAAVECGSLAILSYSAVWMIFG